MDRRTVRDTLRRMGTRERICIGLAVAAVILAVCGIGYTVWHYHSLRVSEQRFEALKEGDTELEITGEIQTQSPYDFDKLRETNGDIYAWLTVPGTDVDYPILQSETDNYYLDHNLDGSQGYPGCLYTNSDNQKDFSDLLTVVYGHDMRSTGTMFHTLHSFEDATFFAENQTMEVYTEDAAYTYTICAASRFSDTYIPSYYGVTEPAARGAFLSHLYDAAEGDEISHTREIPEELREAPLLILSTCIKNQDEDRYLVVGYLSGVEEYR